MIYNLFCDASIDNSRKVACGGCYIISQFNNEFKYVGKRLVIQNNATNNSSEILAIFLGVVEALKLRNIDPGSIFRLFSDSKISLYGVREWIINWINNIDKNGNLISSSGYPVANQQRFIDIYNLIVENNLRIEFYHQRGHVSDGRVPLDKARIQFIRANKITPESLGFSIESLSQYNQIIDNLTRDCVKEYVFNNNIIQDAEIEGIYPFDYSIRSNMSSRYASCISKRYR